MMNFGGYESPEHFDNHVDNLRGTMFYVCQVVGAHFNIVLLEHKYVINWSLRPLLALTVQYVLLLSSKNFDLKYLS